MPLLVRNHEPNATVFGKIIGGENIRVLWGAAGTAEDTQRCPNSFAEDVDFLNSLDRGILEVVEAPENILAGLQRETASLAAERERRSQVAASMVDHQADKSMSAFTCIGPAPRGRSGKCDRSVLVLSKAAKDTPPLCAEHSHLAPEFVLELVGSKGEGATQSRDGDVRHEWTRVQMTAPVKGS